MPDEWPLTEEQLLVRRAAREFCRRELAPRAAETDRGRFPEEAVRAMAGMGLLGLGVPPAYGGGGADAVSAALAMEELAAACPSTSVIWAAHHSLVCEPILRHGTEAQRRAHLPALTEGGMLGCFALTEPGAGSDAAALATTATRTGAGWRVQGGKRFITNAREAGLCVIIAATDRARGHRGISAFLAAADRPGFEVAGVEEKMGAGGSSLGELRFEGLELPPEGLLGEEGGGFALAMQALDGGRVQVGAQGVGYARACLEASIAFARERVTFGVPISRHQLIQAKLADMAMAVEAGRLLVLRAARLKMAGEDFTAEAAMAKVFASDAAQRAAGEAVQIHGGSGYLRDSPVERYYRAAKAAQIYDGTNEILRLVVARRLTG